MPRQFNEWVKNNKERIASAKSLPYFLRDNQNLIKAKNTNISVGGEIGSDVPIRLNTLQRKAWIANEHSVSDIIGNQGSPMEHEKANQNEPNPNYGEAGYTNNCQCCVVAYELRRRGYDVEAMKRIYGDSTNIPDKLSRHTELVWKNFVGEAPISSIAGGIKGRDIDKRGRVITKYKSISELNAELNDLTTNVGRYHIKWEWKESKTGHIVVCEKFGNGGIRIYDPQTGKQLKWGDILKRIDINKGVKILRVDDLMINEDIIDKIVKPKPKS